MQGIRGDTDSGIADYNIEILYAKERVVILLSTLALMYVDERRDFPTGTRDDYWDPFCVTNAGRSR